MSYYFKDYFVNGNELLFIAFLIIIVAIIACTIFIVKKEIKK